MYYIHYDNYYFELQKCAFPETDGHSPKQIGHGPNRLPIV